MIDIAVREHAVNDSALPQSETIQMTYRVKRCVEAVSLNKLQFGQHREDTTSME